MKIINESNNNGNRKWQYLSMKYVKKKISKSGKTLRRKIKREISMANVNINVVAEIMAIW
jgi:hypothetical protein